MSEEEAPRRRVLITPIEPMDAVEETVPKKTPDDAGGDAGAGGGQGEDPNLSGRPPKSRR